MTAKSAFGVLGVAVALAPVYFFSFYFLIKIFNVKTPGRDLMVGEARLFTKADYKASKGLTVDGSKITSADDKEEARLAKAATIIEYLGGEENIVDVDSCASRLRLTVVDSSKANIDGIKSLGGSTGALVKGNNIQVVYGGEQEAIKPRMIKILAEQREAKKANMMVENKVEVKVEENKEVKKAPAKKASAKKSTTVKKAPAKKTASKSTTAKKSTSSKTTKE
ncbi:PTS transporter subunit EIIB [Vibrio harveyi]|nr:PTS transporter subunit EIIB [Vibrio harveyi]